MTASDRELDAAFRTLARRLLARRLAALNGRMRVVLLGLAGYVAAFTYWQVRVPLDGVHRAHGPDAAARLLGIVLLALAAAGALTGAWRRAALAARTPGPEWLALPLPPARVAGLLDADALVTAASAFVPAAAAWLAVWGLARPWQLALLVPGFALAWYVLALAAARIAAFAVLPHGGPGASLPATTRALTTAPAGAATRRVAAPTWRRASASGAIRRLDALATRRRSAARTRMVLALLAFALGAIAWFVDAPPLVRRALSYAAFGAGTAALGGWAIARTCADPDSAIRPLPLDVWDLWRARAGTILALVAATAVLHAGLAFALPPMARVGNLLAWLPSGFAIALLGLHYALSLSPRATLAENLYYGWLVVAMVASWMIPFLGWGVLIAGLWHSTRRLSRWREPEIG